MPKAKTKTHIGRSPSPSPLFVPAATMDQPTPRKTDAVAEKPQVRMETETHNLLFEIHPDGTAGGEKLIRLSEEHAIRSANEYLEIARRKAVFYADWIALMKAGKRRPWRVHV